MFALSIIMTLVDAQLLYLREVGSAASFLFGSLKSSESELDELQMLMAEFSLLAAPPPPSLLSATGASSLVIWAA